MSYQEKVKRFGLSGYYDDIDLILTFNSKCSMHSTSGESSNKEYNDSGNNNFSSDIENNNEISSVDLFSNVLSMKYDEILKKCLIRIWITMTINCISKRV